MVSLVLRRNLFVYPPGQAIKFVLISESGEPVLMEGVVLAGGKGWARDIHLYSTQYLYLSKRRSMSVSVEFLRV